MTDTKTKRPVSVTTPLAPDKLRFESMIGTEELGRAFKYEVDLLSDDHNVAINDVLGRNITIALAAGADASRHFNGFVTRFAYAGSHGRLARYRATVRPWLWFLSRSADCRVFQNKTAIEIVRQVCADHGFTDIDESLSREYASRDFCVQYRETAFNFVCRLLEEEGVYFWFRHEDGKHTLVLCDSPSAHDPVAGYETIRYVAPSDGEDRGDEVIDDWHVAQEVQTGSYSLSDYDFKRPRADLRVAASITRDHAQSQAEVFDYPGEYVDSARGQNLVQARIQELHGEHEVAAGQTDARGVRPGAVFTLQSYPRRDQNRAYLITSATFELRNPDFESGQTAADVVPFRCEFACIDAHEQFRTARLTPKPVVQGPQTARVVGPDGERIWTDEYGRVKVQFHWDREGNNDEQSSCWVRVSQGWAGASWGAMFLPHIGQEVIVEFLEGDPDRPLVTGRVYNADNMPPLALPENKHKSIIRDDFGNEMVFDATPGDEHIALHAPNHDTVMLLGKSLKYRTDSDRNAWTFGDATSGVLGSSASLQIGAVASATIGIGVSFFGGTALSMFMGAGVDVAIGYKLGISLTGSTSLNWGYAFSYTKAKQLEYGNETWTKHTDGNLKLDTERTGWFVGGNGDSSFVKLAQDDLVLSYKKSNVAAKSEADTKNAARTKMLQMLRAQALGGVAALSGSVGAVSAAYMSSSAYSAVNDDKEKYLAATTDAEQKAQATLTTASGEATTARATANTKLTELNQRTRELEAAEALPATDPTRASQIQTATTNKNQAQGLYDAAATEALTKENAYLSAKSAYDSAKTAREEVQAQIDTAETWRLGAAIGGVVVSAGLGIGFGVATHKSAKKVFESAAEKADPTHADPDARIELKNDGVHILAGASKVIVTKNGEVTIESNQGKDLTVKSGGNLNLQVPDSKGVTIKVGNAAAMTIKSKALKINKKIHHKNMMVLE